MNLLDMFKQLTNDEKKEFIKLIIEEINKTQKCTVKIMLDTDNFKVNKNGLVKKTR